MKKTTLVLLSVLVLSACGSSNDDNTSGSVNADTVLDDQIFAQATSNQSLKRCDEISNSSKLEECKLVIQDTFMMQEALRDLNLSKCDDLKLDRYLESCKSAVNEALDRDKEQETQKEKDAKDQTSVQAALDNGDPKLCDKAENEEVKYTCRYNILVGKAIAAKDASLCEDIGYESYESDCKAAVEETD